MQAVLAKQGQSAMPFQRALVQIIGPQSGVGQDSRADQRQQGTLLGGERSAGAGFLLLSVPKTLPDQLGNGGSFDCWAVAKRTRAMTLVYASPGSSVLT